MKPPASLPPDPPRHRLAVGLAALLLVAGVVVGYADWLSHVRSEKLSGPGPVALAPGAVPPPSAAPVTSPAPAPPVPPVRPHSAHEFVRASWPTEFTLTGPAFTIKAHVCAMANIRPYDPPGEQHHTVCWVAQGFGVAPSSGQRATSYLFGHSWAEDPLEVLNKLSAFATAEVLQATPHPVDGVPVYPVDGLVGYRLILRTRTGTLTYRVRSAWGVRKSQLGYITSWMDPTVRNRVLLTTCAELNGRDYDYNIVADAGLLSSRRR